MERNDTNNDNDNDKDVETKDYEPVRIHFIAAIIVCHLIALVSGFAGYELHDSQLGLFSRTANDRAAEVQANAQKAQFDFQLSSQRVMTEIQKKVADNCVAHGLNPSFVGGNVICPAK